MLINNSHDGRQFDFLKIISNNILTALMRGSGDLLLVINTQISPHLYFLLWLKFTNKKQPEWIVAASMTSDSQIENLEIQ